MRGPVVPHAHCADNGCYRSCLYRDTIENWAQAGALVDLTEPIDDYRLARDLAEGTELERVHFGRYAIAVIETPQWSWSYYRMLVNHVVGTTVASIDLMRSVGTTIAVPGFMVRVGKRVTTDPPHQFGWDVTYRRFRVGARKRLEEILLRR